MYRRSTLFCLLRVPTFVGLACSLALATLLFSPDSAYAEDDIVIVPAQRLSLAIPEIALIENDPGASAILDHSPAGRGDLEYSGGVFTYTPGDSFSQVGLDSFTYQTSSGVDPNHTVFLVRGLDQVLVADGLTEMKGKSCQLASGWALTSGGESPTVAMQADGSCGVIYDLSSGATYAQMISPLDPVLPGPGGGYTEFTIDNGGDLPPGGSTNENLIAVGTTMGANGQPMMIFGLRLTSEGLVAMAREGDGSMRESMAVPLTQQSHVIGLTWWFEGRGQTANGGLFLEVDGEMVARLRRVRNFDFLGQPVDWQLGPQNVVGLQGEMIFTSASLWLSPTQPRFSPIFADHGFLPTLWDRTVNPGDIQNGTPPGSSDQMWSLDVDPSAGRTQLVDELSEGATPYHARFHVAVDKLVPFGTASMTFFEAESVGGSGDSEETSPRPFRLELTHRPFLGYSIRATVEEGSFQRSTAWLDIPTAGFSVVEVSWLAESAPGASDGRLHLTVNESEASLASVTGTAAGIGEVRLGPSDLTQGISGSLVVDQFDSWE